MGEVVTQIHDRIKRMIVRVLMLEGVTPEEIGEDQPLFGAGLGLDSVDALELAIHIEEEFGVRMPDDAEGRKAFATVRSLASFIEERK
jgi:acyl carrier protein